MAMLEENAVIGPYRIIRKLGQGGMGAVYEALHQSLGRHVAIKVLHPEVARNEEFAIRFANEARASNIVDHPDVVQITDHGQLPDGIPYIVMEYLKGESLGHRIEHLGGPMNPSEVAFLALQMADVLSVAHARGIIHREAYVISKVCFHVGHLGPQRRRNKPCPLTEPAAARSALTSH
ncbi:MAG: serine/threonine protein kinase [Myxococcales bacterium]|nr:serine/threonine protein kinase [Myxococcales bacterium]